MRKFGAGIFLLLMFQGAWASFFPFFSGARDLSLAQGSMAFSYDFHSGVINPALLYSLSFSLQGTQYQQNYSSFGGLSANLDQLFPSAELGQWDQLGQERRAELWSQVGAIYAEDSFLQGFVSKGAGFASRNLAVSYFTVNWSWLRPDLESLAQIANPQDPSFQDLEKLRFSQLGAKYKQLAASYAFSLGGDLSVGVTLNYITGKARRASFGMLDLSAGDPEKGDLVRKGWDFEEGEKLSRIYFDTGLLYNVGTSLSLALVVRGVGKPVLEVGGKELILDNQTFVGISFRPAAEWGIYFSALLVPQDLYQLDIKQQPVAIAIEKSFFESQFFVRAGLRSDLKAEYLLGKNSPMRISCGAGINLSPLLGDVGLVLNSRMQLDGFSLNLIVINR